MNIYKIKVSPKVTPEIYIPEL